MNVLTKCESIKRIGEHVAACNNTQRQCAEDFMTNVNSKLVPDKHVTLYRLHCFPNVKSYDDGVTLNDCLAAEDWTLDLNYCFIKAAVEALTDDRIEYILVLIKKDVGEDVSSAIQRNLKPCRDDHCCLSIELAKKERKESKSVEAWVKTDSDYVARVYLVNKDKKPYMDGARKLTTDLTDVIHKSFTQAQEAGDAAARKPKTALVKVLGRLRKPYRLVFGKTRFIVVRYKGMLVPLSMLRAKEKEK